MLYSLGGNRITSKGATRLFDMLNHHASPLSIISIDLSHNQLDDKCLKSVARFVNRTPSIQSVWVSECNINDKALKAFEDTLSVDTKLEYLGLNGNKDITDKSIIVLMKLLEKSRIEILDLNETSVTYSNLLIIPLSLNSLKNGASEINLNGKCVVDDDIINVCDVFKNEGGGKVNIIE